MIRGARAACEDMNTRHDVVRVTPVRGRCQPHVRDNNHTCAQKTSGQLAAALTGNSRTSDSKKSSMAPSVASPKPNRASSSTFRGPKIGGPT